MNGIIVLGCYRSGSSAVAGILNHLGVCMGSSLDPPSKGNPQGYYEDIEFKDLHKKMMDDEDVTKEYKSLLEKRRKLPLWGLKDPRLCLLIHQLPLSPDYVIVTHRDKTEIAHSLKKIMESPTAKQWIPLIDHYLEKRDLWLKCYTGIIMDVRFDELRSHPHRVVESIANFVSLPFRKEAVDFISFS